MSRHTWQADGDRCGTCANHKGGGADAPASRPDGNAKYCVAIGSPFNGEEVDAQTLGRMDDQGLLYCGVWVGGKRFTKETKDIA